MSAAHRPRSRTAWERRGRILSHRHRPSIARRFLHTIIERSREACTVPQIARLLGVSRSGLERICRSTFHLSPGVMIDLSRVVSIARDLRETDRTLREISIGHGFPTPSVMNRFFARFAGMPPRMYRERHGAKRPDGAERRWSGH